MASEVTKLQSAKVFETKAEQAKALREELNSYAQALHRPHVSGLSLFELAGEVSRSATERQKLTDHDGLWRDLGL